MVKRKSAGTAWTDNELMAALDSYLYMLQLEVSSIPISATSNSQTLIDGPLKHRNEASIRYRMRNISFLMEERGLPSLRAFSPAPQVGRHVKSRLFDMMEQRTVIIEDIARINERTPTQPSMSEVLDRLDDLKSSLEAISSTNEIGIGHNNPPEVFQLADEVPELIVAVEEIKNELVQDSTDKTIISLLSQKLVNFGLKMAVWSGQRITDFAKAGAIASGTSWGLSHADLGAKIIDVVRSVLQLLF